MSNPELKPCPFCGGHAKIVTYIPGSYYAECVICGSTGGKSFSTGTGLDLKILAITKWNSRLPTPDTR